MLKTKPQPLDLEELADKIIRVEYPTYEQTTIPQMKNAIIRNKHLIKQILEQVMQSAVQGLKEDVGTWCFKKFTTTREYGELVDLIKKWFPDEVLK